jgi:acid phosphatase (class A)
MKLKYFEKQSINEEWSTESPVGTDWSFLPEEITSSLNPNFLNVSQPPLGNLSVENEEGDIQRLLLLQECMNSEDVKFIKATDECIESVFYECLAKCGQKPKMSQIKSFKLNEKQNEIIDKIKEGVKRERPFEKYDQVKKVIECGESYSYPSKTTSECYIMAEKLCECYPHLREGLYALANKISTSRVQGGVHYHSDIDAGKSIAKALLAK